MLIGSTSSVTWTYLVLHIVISLMEFWRRLRRSFIVWGWLNFLENCQKFRFFIFYLIKYDLFGKIRYVPFYL